MPAMRMGVDSQILNQGILLGLKDYTVVVCIASNDASSDKSTMCSVECAKYVDLYQQFCSDLGGWPWRKACTNQ